MRILVTGGTGFLGGRLLPRLIAEGHEVFGLVRSERSSSQLRGVGVTPVVGDLESTEPLQVPALDVVVHAAASFRFSGPRAPFLKTNVEGTRALLAAAKAAGARAFVHVSAAGVVMDDAGTPVRLADNQAPTYPDSFSGYLASKARAEDLVLAANEPGFRTIALRPCAIWGPGDKFSQELPRALGSGRFAFIDRGDYSFSTTHVDNVVEAILCALDHGMGGSAYFISDRQTGTFREFIDMIATAHGRAINQVRSMPYPVAHAIGAALDWWWQLTGKNDDPPLSRSMVRMIGREFTVDDKAARRELGYVGQVTRIEGQRMYSHLTRPQPS